MFKSYFTDEMLSEIDSLSLNAHLSHYLADDLTHSGLLDSFFYSNIPAHYNLFLSIYCSFCKSFNDDE